MLTPFPYDVIGHWMQEYNVELPSEAYHELARLFTDGDGSFDSIGNWKKKHNVDLSVDAYSMLKELFVQYSSLSEDKETI